MPVAVDATAAKKVALRPPAGRIAMRDPAIVPADKQNVPPEISLALPIQPDSFANQLQWPTSPDPHVAPPPNEHALLTTVLRRLRTEHDPVSALAALDDYRLRFPSGGLAPEAAMLRAEALLQIGRKGDALDELDRLSLGRMPNSDERYVLRGELRAAVGRWREALGDFDIVLRGHAEGKTEIGAATDMKLRDRLERALWGRALARSRLGNDAGARADLQECLRRFPRGRFASEATRLLGGQR
jgi:tetratricopeptide (TPR) repeat protein